MNKHNILHFSEQMKDIILHRRKMPGTGKELMIKPLHLPRDIHIIHKWVNQPQAKQFWQMDGTVKNLYKHYEDFLNAGTGYSLICYLDDKPVAHVDYYKVATDEVREHFNYCETDFGIHLLMGNYNVPISHLTREVMITALSFLFTLDIDRIVGEPDAQNEKADKLVIDVGFRFIKTIEMSYKTANLYIFERGDFIKKYESPKK